MPDDEREPSLYVDVLADLTAVSKKADPRPSSGFDSVWELVLENISPGKWASPRFPKGFYRMNPDIGAANPNQFVGQRLKFTLARESLKKYGRGTQKEGQEKPRQFNDSWYWGVVAFGQHTAGAMLEQAAPSSPGLAGERFGDPPDRPTFEDLESASAAEPASEPPPPESRPSAGAQPPASAEPLKLSGATYRMSFQRVFNLGNYESERIEVGAEFPAEFDPVDALTTLRATVMGAHDGERRGEKPKTNGVRVPDDLTIDGFYAIMEANKVTPNMGRDIMGCDLATWTGAGKSYAEAARFILEAMA